MSRSLLIPILLLVPGQAAPPPAPEVLVRPLEGPPLRARLLDLRDGRIFLEKEREILPPFPLDSLEEISFGDYLPGPPRGPFLFLEGGQGIPVDRIRAGRRGGLIPTFAGRRLKEVPLEALAGFQWPRRPARGLPPSLEGMDPSRRPSGRDRLFLVKDRKILQAAVTVLSFGRGGVRFRFAGRERSLPLWKTAGLLLARTGKAPARPGETAPAEVEFLRGGRLLGRVLGGGPEGLRFLHPVLGAFLLPWREIRVLRPSRNRVREASSWKLLSEKVRPAFDRVWPVARDRNLEGRPIRIHGRYFQGGLVFLPARSLTFRVPPGFTLFKASLGIEDSGGPGGEALFRVRAGGKVLLEKILRAGSPPLEVSLDLKGAREITLETDFGPALDLGDHCAFARARLVEPPGEGGGS